MKPRLLFVGATGGARAPIAAGLAQALGGGNVTVGCAAISPREIHLLAVHVMAERGIVPPALAPLTAVFPDGIWNHIFLLCHEVATAFSPSAVGSALSENSGCPVQPELLDWYCPDPLAGINEEAACLLRLRVFRDDMERKLTKWLADKNLFAANDAALQRVWRELACYEHPLFDWEAVPAGENVEIRIRFKPSTALCDGYAFQLRPRELESRQFPWLFQKQLYDCLHDYVIELFSRNPQQDES